MTQPTPAPDAAARDLMAAQAEEYGTYVATQDIHVGLALAYRAGDPVPVSNVKIHGYDKIGWVAKTGTKAAAAATSEGAK
jgi:hypothetical protein